jgi:predicted CXXCH cytochrome family protein
LNEPRDTRANTARALAVALLLSAATAHAAISPAGPASVPGMVGAAVCAECHPDQTRAWRGSHHDLAMQEAVADTVLGNFADATFEHDGVAWRFHRREGRFHVTTEGTDGHEAEFEVLYAFGVTPLQQYLVATDRGRLQALRAAWDTRPAAEGGQRWFALYPGQHIPPGDELHWTGRQQNWNFMCAECHSTALARNYDATTDTYATTWAEIDVACEACHGAGAAHVAWARRRAARDADEAAGTQADAPAGQTAQDGVAGEAAAEDGDMGLALRFDERRGVTWTIKPGDTTATRSERPRPPAERTEVETCAPCHARRAVMWPEHRSGAPLLDGWIPALLTEDLYFADGQMREETYVYGSFLQSRMYQAGVTCSDCHDPHSLALRAPADAVCLQCHSAAAYRTVDHHHHPEESSGARCAECHMAPRTYMVVDARHEHGMRVPRPDLSAKFATPNACTDCHLGSTPAWAADKVRQWYGRDAGGFGRWAPALDAGRRGGAEAEAELVRLADDLEMPAIVRATALASIQTPTQSQTARVLTRSLADLDPMVRRAAAELAASIPAEARVGVLAPLLDDPVRGVRLAAARSLADLPPETFDSATAAGLERALQEYRRSQQANADRPESWTNLGNLALARGDADAAAVQYRRAVGLAADFTAAWVNLAEALRVAGRGEDAVEALREGLAASPDAAELHSALGLALVRTGQAEAALPELARAAELAPEIAWYGYSYGVALHSSGQPERAIAVLEEVIARHPLDRSSLYALVAFHRDRGRMEAAQAWAARLAPLVPEDAAIRALADSAPR